MNWLKYLLGFSAILVAGCAAYFSVTGLGLLFSGASVSVMIMAGALEFAKLVSATYLKQKWTVLKGFNKWYLTSAVVILMAITSAGIFGFLSNAFQQQNIKLDQVKREITVWESKIKTNEEQVITLTTQLNNLQNNQTTIIDKGKVNKSLLRSIDNRDKTINNIQKKITIYQDSTLSYNQHINDIKNNNIGLEREIGGFRFVAEAFNVELNTVVKFFILLIIFVFDPLAIALVVAFNQMLIFRKKKEDIVTEKEDMSPQDLMSEISRVRLTDTDLEKLDSFLNKKQKEEYTINTNNDEFIDNEDVVEEPNKQINKGEDPKQPKTTYHKGYPYYQINITDEDKEDEKKS
jgi:hypothetical protein